MPLPRDGTPWGSASPLPVARSVQLQGAASRVGACSDMEQCHSNAHGSGTALKGKPPMACVCSSIWQIPIGVGHCGAVPLTAHRQGHCGNASLITYGCGVLWGTVEVSLMVLGYRALGAVGWTGMGHPAAVPPMASMAKGHHEALPPHVHSYGTPLPRSNMGKGHQAAVPMFMVYQSHDCHPTDRNCHNIGA